MSETDSHAAADPAPLRHPRSAASWLIGGVVIALTALITTHVFSTDRAGLVAAASFTAVLTAAMLISWGAEAGQFFLSQGFAVAIVALLQVMPEFMVEAVIAWKGDIKLMFANATGSNRLLIGLGWPLIYFTATAASQIRRGHGAGDVKLGRENTVELLSLLLASCYYLKLLAFGCLSIFDGLFLCGCYVGYMIVLSRLPEEKAESKADLLAPARVLAEVRSPSLMRVYVFGLFIVGGLVMAFVSDPFVESLKTVAFMWGISGFTFIQWVAPFLSEFPEKVTAFYWSQTVRLAPMALLNMISSTVSQFTLLVGMIPLVYAVAVWSGHVEVVEVGLFGFPVVPIRADHLRSEIFLSWAMTMLGCAQIAKRRFTWPNAAVILVIWIAQFLTGPIERLTHIPGVDQRLGLGAICVAFALLEIAITWRELDLRSAIRETFASMRQRNAA